MFELPFKKFHAPIASILTGNFHLGKLETTFHSHSSQNVQNFGVNTEYHFANILSQSYEKWGTTESKGYPLEQQAKGKVTHKQQKTHTAGV